MNSLRRNPAYRRLRAGGRGLTGSSSYWLAADHLMIVEDSGFSERSRRVELRDITALVVVATGAGRSVTVGLVLALAGAAVLLLFLATGPESSGVRLAVAGILAAALALALTVHLARGPTCRGVLHTRVQAWPLPQLSRWPAARRLLEALRPAVLAAQAAEPAPPAVATTPPPAPPPVAA